jgi:hypothetical protein
LIHSIHVNTALYSESSNIGLVVLAYFACTPYKVSYSRGPRELFNSAEQFEKRPEASIGKGKAREVGGIWDVMSQTVETKNTTGS